MSPFITNRQIEALAKDSPSLFWLNLTARRDVARFLRSRGYMVNQMDSGDTDRLQALVAEARKAPDYHAFVASLYETMQPDPQVAAQMASPVAPNMVKFISSYYGMDLGNTVIASSIPAARAELHMARACASPLAAGRMDKYPALSTFTSLPQTGAGSGASAGTPYVFGSGLDPQTGAPLPTTPTGGNTGTGKYKNFLENTLGFLNGLTESTGTLVSQYKEITTPAVVPPPVAQKEDNTALYLLGVVFVLALGALLYFGTRNKKS
jgi:hypothetical protein